MTWSYSGDPLSSKKDAVRFMLGLTDEEQQLVTDEEIEYFIDKEGQATRAAYRVAESIAGKYSRLADRTIGDYSESYSQISEQFLRLAERLRKAVDDESALKAIPYAGGISKTDKENVEENKDRVKPFFERDKFENPFKARAWDDNKWD